MKTAEEILDELVEEPDNYGNGFEWLCTKEEAINCMEAYASEQTEKYKELIKAYELYREWLGVDIVKCKNAWDKVKQLKTELGL